MNYSSVYVLFTHWDSIANEGCEVIGVYSDKNCAITTMKKCAQAIKDEYPSDYWDDDYTWEDEFEINLGSAKDNPLYANLYNWTISKCDIL